MFALAASASLALAGADARDIISLRRNFAEAAADPIKRAMTIAAGREASAMCAGCHGLEGNSSMPDVPNLAGQNAVYMLVQFDKLEAGLRGHKTMEVIVKTLSPQDRFNIAFYYSTLAMKAAPSKQSAASLAGQRIFISQFCTECHGDKALGTDHIPRLAGQQRDYLARALAQYRDRSGERLDSMMSLVVEMLSDRDIASLAEYLSGLNIDP